MSNKKIVRICWNTNSWEFPSGPIGKSKNKKSYEYQTGFGHEEWLFDLDKLINGYHYGYLQAIGGFRNTYIGNKFDVSFYSINSATTERWWIGRVHELIIVDDVESINILKIYKHNGWHKEMIQQLTKVGANVNEFKKTPNDSFFTVKFKPSTVQLLTPPLRFQNHDPAITSDYYNLKNWVKQPKLDESSNKFLFYSGHTSKKNPRVRNYHSQSIISDPVHNVIQEDCYKILCKEHGGNNVSTEQNDGSGNRIDIVVKNQAYHSHWFYEIKTYNTGTACLREGISQLMEYAYYTDIKGKNVDKLIIISPNDLMESDCEYLSILRLKFKLPIYHQKYDIENKKLVDVLQ
ncbi:MAG TPA: hypothetical protein DCO75_12095 [Fibrobacteres bacterium]|nr:hypothetical protein [Fibrobacterota bacterium]